VSPKRWDTAVPCRVPLRRVPNAFDLPNGLTVHEGIVADVKWADRRWRQLGGPKFWVVRARDTGSYNCRNSVAHSRAIGVDFNWSSNGMTSKRTPCPGDMPAAFYEECWKPIGYGWGANWRSKCDRMHISKVPSEGGDGWLYVVHDGDGEEDGLAVTDKQFADLVETVDDIRAAVLTSGSDAGKKKLDLLQQYVDGRFDAIDTKLAEIVESLKG
jgi:hypothetical protein